MAAEIPVKISLIGMEQVEGALQSLGKTLIGLFAAEKLFKFAETGIEEWSKMQTASNELAASLGHQSEALVKLGEASARTSKFRAEEIVGGEKILSNYTKNDAVIKQLLPTLLNLGTRTGDINTAAKMLGLSYEKGTTILSRYGINVTGAAGSQERLQSIIQQTAAALGDQNRAAFEAMNPLEKMNKLWVESSAAIGEALVPQLNDLFDVLPDFTSLLGNITKGIVTLFNVAGMGLSVVATGVVGIGDLILKVITMIPGHPKFLDSWKQDMDFALKTMDETNKNFVESINKTWSGVKPPPFVPGGGKRTPAGVKVKDPQADAEAKQEVARQQEITDTINGIIKRGDEAGLDENQKKIMDLDKQYAKEYTLIEGHLAAQNALTKTYTIERAKLVSDEEKKVEKQSEKDDRETLKAQEIYDISQDKQLTKTTAGKIKKLQTEYKTERDLLKKHHLDTYALEIQYTKEIESLKQQEVLNKISFDVDYASTTIGLMGQIAEAAGANAIVMKRISEGEAIISAAKGVLGVVENSAGFISSFGPIGGPIAMGIEIALIAALAVAQIAKLESAKMASGGVVTGGTPGQDSVNATLMPDEIVYNPHQPNPQLAAMVAASAQQNGYTSSSTIHMGDININGNADMSTVRAIRTSQNDQLKQYKKLMMSGQRLRQLA